MELSAYKSTYSVAGNPQLRMFTEFGLVAASRLWGFVLTRLAQCFDTQIETRYLAFLRQMIVSVRQYRPLPRALPKSRQTVSSCATPTAKSWPTSIMSIMSVNRVAAQQRGCSARMRQGALPRTFLSYRSWCARLSGVPGDLVGGLHQLLCSLPLTGHYLFQR